VAKLSLLLCYYGENNLPFTLFKICTEFNKKTVCVPVKPQCIISATLAMRWQYFATYYLSTVFASSFVMKTHIQKKLESANKLRSQIGIFFEVLFKAVC